MISFVKSSIALGFLMLSIMKPLLVQAGDTESQREEITIARDYCETLLSELEDTHENPRAIYQLYRELGDATCTGAMSLVLLKELAKQYASGSSSGHILFAIVCSLEGNYQQAITHCKKVNEAHKNSVSTKIILIDAFLAMRQYSSAKSTGLELVNAMPKEALAHTIMGRICMESGDIAAGLAAISEAINLDSGFAEAYFWLGVALESDGRDQQAEDAWDKFLALHPHSLRASMVERGWVVIYPKPSPRDYRYIAPRWSPDGKHLVVTKRVGKRPYESRALYLVDLRTRQETALALEDNVYNHIPKWSPDGRYVLFTRDESPRKASSQHINLIDVRTKRRFLLTPTSDLQSFFVGISDEGLVAFAGSGPAIWFGDLKSREFVPFGPFAVASGKISFSVYSAPSLSPLGGVVVCPAWIQTPRTVPKDRSLLGTDIFAFREGITPIRLSNGRGTHLFPDVSPNNRDVVFSSYYGAGAYQISVTDINGTCAVVPVARGQSPPYASVPSWSPDGRAIIETYNPKGSIGLRLGGKNSRLKVSVHVNRNGFIVKAKNGFDTPRRISLAYRVYGPLSQELERGELTQRPYILKARQTGEFLIKTLRKSNQYTIKVILTTKAGDRLVRLFECTGQPVHIP